jgi:hypothetical protein
MATFRSILAVGLALAISACGGGGDDDDGGDLSPPPPPPPTSVGMFLDAAVQGLGYQSGSNPPASTNENGEFTYEIGAPLTFSIGCVELGTLPDGAPVVTPFDFGPDAAINIARLLQTLDLDSDPANGIDISEAAAALSSCSIGDATFLSDALTFESEIAPVLQDALGAGASLIDEATAVLNLAAGTESRFITSELAGNGFVAYFPSLDELGVMNFAPLNNPGEPGSTVMTMWDGDTIDSGGDGTVTIENWSLDGDGVLIISDPTDGSSVTIEKVGRTQRTISILAREAPGADPIVGTLFVPAAATIGSLAGVEGRTYRVVDEGGATEGTFLPDGTVESLDDGMLSVQPWEIDSNEVLVSVFDLVDPEINLFALVTGNYSDGGEILLISATNLSGDPGAPVLQLDEMSVGSLEPVIASDIGGVVSYAFITGEMVVMGDPGDLSAVEQFFLGRSASGTFLYDNQAGIAGTVGIGQLIGAAVFANTQDFSASIGELDLFDPEGGTIVANNRAAGGTNDVLQVIARDFPGIEVEGFALTLASLVWSEALFGAGDFLSNEQLPQTLPAFDGRLSLTFESIGNPGEVVSVFFQPLTASPVL